MLKRHTIGLHVGDVEGPVADWDVYRGLVVESEIDGRAYVLSEGEWYEVAASLSDSVRMFMNEFRTGSVVLDTAGAEEDERAYNFRNAAQFGYVLGDRILVKPLGARTSIEFCDLLTPSRQIIHVKARTSSSTLSHLFGQAFSSGEAFLYDVEFRLQVRDKLGAEAAELVPVEPPRSQDYEIAFAIIGGPSEGWPHSLPFLSKLNFRNAVQRLRRFGYRVSLTHVPRD